MEIELFYFNLLYPSTPSIEDDSNSKDDQPSGPLVSLSFIEVKQVHELTLSYV